MNNLNTQYENERFIIFYNHNDENIEQLITTLESKSKEIMNFFGLENISRKVIVKIYYSIDDYKKHLIPYLEEMGETYHDWMIADTMDDNINMLELSLCRELSSHRNETIGDQMQNILHEFAHICHHELLGENNSHGHIWFSEALATNLSGQDYNGTEIICTYEKLKNDFNNAPNNYPTSYLMGKYMIENYGRNFVLDLIKNWQLLDELAPRLFEETKAFYNQNEMKKK